jgi:predicted RNA binding protein YcfA (HicA-like mRNA interferase family)
MPERMRRMTAREVERLLVRFGFTLVSQRGSHRKWRNEESGLQVIVPEHRGRELPTGTLRAILKGSELPESEWRG